VGIFPTLADECRSARAQRAKHGGAGSASSRATCVSVSARVTRRTRLGHHGVCEHLQENEGRTRHDEQRTTPRRGIKGESHRRASAVVYRHELGLGAGVRTATTPSHPRSLHKNSTTRRPVHRFSRHDATRGTRHSVRWPSVQRSQVWLDASRTSAPGTVAWGCCVRD
jgi:hypothetical protein